MSAATLAVPPAAGATLPPELVEKLGLQVGKQTLLVSPAFVPGVFLISSDGHCVKEWQSKYWSAGAARLLQDGSVLRVVAEIPYPKGTRTQFTGGRIEWIGLDGVIKWSHWRNSPEQRVHHDVVPISNGNVAALTWIYHKASEFINRPDAPERWRQAGVWTDGVTIFQPSSDGGGRVIAGWDSFAHWGNSETLEKGVIPLGVSVSAEEIEIGVFGNCTRIDAQGDRLLLFSSLRQEAWTLEVSAKPSPSIGLIGVDRFSPTPVRKCLGVGFNSENDSVALWGIIGEAAITSLAIQPLLGGEVAVSTWIPPDLKNAEIDGLDLGASHHFNVNTFELFGNPGTGFTQLGGIDTQTGTGWSIQITDGKEGWAAFDWPKAIPEQYRQSPLGRLEPTNLAKIAKKSKRTSAELLKKANASHEKRARQIRGARPYLAPQLNP